MAGKKKQEAQGLPELLSTKDVAGLLRTTPRQVWNMHSRGQLPKAQRLPGLGLRWKRADVAAWIEAHHAGGTR